MNAKLVVALDVPTAEQALDLAKKLQPVTPWVKVGLELFTVTGPSIVSELKKLGCNVFLDLKFHDIPNTVRGAIRSAIKAGADICDIHCCGGEAMGRAAAEEIQEARKNGSNCILLGVTVLTSTSPEELGTDVKTKVTQLASNAKLWGLDGIVCSGQEASAVKEACGEDFICLCPGIRPKQENAVKDDQKRVLTPSEAAKAGANFLVVGRPITKASDPVKAASDVMKELAEI